jgi:hypothetical protein
MVFDQIRKRIHVKGQPDRGLQIVPLDSIVGSEWRHRGFDQAFFLRQSRTKDRWVNVEASRD